MFNCTCSSDPAYPYFRKNCLPKEEQVEKNQNFNFFKKKWCMNQQTTPKHITQWSENDALD